MHRKKNELFYFLLASHEKFLDPSLLTLQEKNSGAATNVQTFLFLSFLNLKQVQNKMTNEKNISYQTN